MAKNKKPKLVSGGTPRRSRRIYVLVALLVLLFGIFLYNGGIAGVATTYAKNALLANDAKRASSWLKIARTIGSETPELHYLLARSARLSRKYNEMASHLQAALSGGYNSEMLAKEQCLAIASLGELDPINESKIKNWIAQDGPDVAEFVDAYVNGLAALSRFDDASKVLEQYEAEYPNDPMVNYRFGLMNEHTKSNELAEKEYAEAMRKDPNHAKSAWRYARLLCGRNRPEDAIKVLEKIRKGPQELAVKTFLASCHFQMGELEKSRELFKEVVLEDKQRCLEAYLILDEWPERFLAASELGIVESNLGNYPDAKKYLEMALADNPRDFTARSAYALVIRRLGDTEQANKELERVSAERAEFDKITVLRDKVKQDPNDAAAKFAMGEILFKYESERFGLFWIRSALTSDPNYKEAHVFLADYYQKKSAENEAFKGKAEYHQRRAKQLEAEKPV
jgi:Tfp pilus assembly protein PilF